MKKMIITLFFVLASSPLHASVTNISNQQLIRLMDEGIPVIDIRRPEEWRQTGIVKGSHLMTFFDKRGNYDLESWMEKLGKIAGPNDPFILICRTGNRTGKIGQLLDRRLNYTQVHHVANGITHWIKEGHGTVQFGP